jgi:ATP-dependent DNA helicase RecG
MLKSELLEIIANGENSGVEFKRDDIRPEQIAKEIVALANFQGGYLLIGVEDDGVISGIQRLDLEAWIMDTVFGHYVHPLILPFYEEVLMDGGKKVAVVSFSSGTAKPYVLRHNQREEIYIRIGTVSRLATREQQARLFESGGMLHAEVLPVSGTTLDNLDKARLTDYLVNITGDTAPPDTKNEWERRLTGLGLMVNSSDGKVLCTIAGIVLFGQNPHRNLPQAGLRWMSFSSIDKEYKAQDDAFLDGPLVALWEGRPGSGRQINQSGLIEIVAERILPFISEEADSSNDQLRRDREFYYPLDALREAILNAMAHRDWTRALEVEVVNYKDRLEVMSPGALQNSMTLEKMFAGQRSVRNPIILETLRDYGYIDMRGMGIRNKIIPLTKEYTGKEPIFEPTDDFLRVTIPSRVKGEVG